MKFIAAFFWLLFYAAQAMAQETPSPSPSPSPSRPGPTNNTGFPAVDPSENVKALNEAASRRQDDLRMATERLIEAKLKGAEELNYARYEAARQLDEAEAKRIDSEARLRAEYTDKLAVAEAKRIDAIRAVDVNAVAVASERAGATATALATQVNQSAEVLRNQVVQSAEALRGLVASTAATALQNQQQQTAALSTRIAALEQSQSEGKGKQTFQDPAFSALLAEVRALSQARADQAGVGTGRSDVIGWLVGGFGLLIAFGGLLVVMFRRPSS